MFVRRIAAMLLGLIALVFGLLAEGKEYSIDRTIEKSQRLDRQFNKSAVVIDDFRQTHGRQPTPDEFEAIAPKGRGDLYEISLKPGGFDLCIRDNATFSRIGQDEYVLTAWRGEWFECYAPAKRKSTLLLNPNAYTLLGRHWLDTAFFLVIASLCFAVSIRLWIRKKPVDT